MNYNKLFPMKQYFRSKEHDFDKDAEFTLHRNVWKKKKNKRNIGFMKINE